MAKFYCYLAGFIKCEADSKETAREKIIKLGQNIKMDIQVSDVEED